MKYLLSISNSSSCPKWYKDYMDKENKIIIKYISWSSIYFFLDNYTTTDENTKLLLNEFTNYLSDLGYSYYKGENMKDLLKITNDYRETLLKINARKENLLNLGKKITNYLDEEIINESHKWEYHILDEKWLLEWKTLFEFQFVNKEKYYRIAFEIHTDYSGWYGLSEWGKYFNGNLLDLIKGNIIESKNFIIEKENNKYSCCYKEMSKIEIDNIFSGKYTENINIFEDIKYLFSLLPIINKIKI